MEEGWEIVPLRYSKISEYRQFDLNQVECPQEVAGKDNDLNQLEPEGKQ